MSRFVRLPSLRRALVAVIALMLVGPVVVTAPPALAQGSIPRGSNTQGAWGPSTSWPFVPIHAAIDGNGNLLTYGRADSEGSNEFDVWNPRTRQHTTSRNTTGSDLFCSITVQDPDSGSLFVLGGDEDNGRDNDYALKFDNGRLTAIPGAERMNEARWYPSATPLSDGRILIQGGIKRDAPFEDQEPIFTPEIYTPGQGFRLLPGARSEVYDNNGWYYPRTWLMPNGRIFGIAAGSTYYIDVEGSGSVTRLAGTGRNGAGTVGASVAFATYDVGKALLVGGQELSGRNLTRSAAIVDLTNNPPTVDPIAAPRYGRDWANATVLPTGEVFVNGGSSVGRGDQSRNENMASRTPEMFNPGTGQWRDMATVSGIESRLYHSTQVLLADGTVWTGGGGLPGQLTHRNARIYYPPYLYNRDGSPAQRPNLAGVPPRAEWGSTVPVTVSGSIDSAVLIRNGSQTHATNAQLRVPVAMQQSGNTVRFTVPTNRNVVPPGDYMLFVVDDGVPSVAQILTVGEVDRDDDDNDAVAISVQNRTVGEGIGQADIWVARSGSSNQATTFKFATQAGSAAQGRDYYGTYQQLSIPAGANGISVNVTILDDAITESNETFGVRIWDASVPIGRANATVTINDNDVVAESTVGIEPGDFQLVNEGRTAQILLRREGATSQRLRVKFSTVKGSPYDETLNLPDATPGQDFYGTFQIVEFAPGQRERQVPVEIIADSVREDTEVFTVRIWDADTADIRRGQDSMPVWVDD